MTKTDYLKYFLLISFLSITTLCNAESTEGNIGYGQQSISQTVQPLSEYDQIIKRVLSATDYYPTPGDVYLLIIRLDEIFEYQLVLTPEYTLEVPYIGTTHVQNMNFTDLRKQVQKQIKSSIPIADYISFTLSSPALFDILVYGGVKNPGITSVTPLDRVLDAILIADGFQKGASFRRIRLTRDNQLFPLDLLRFTSEADLSQNPLVQPGDKIFVPHASILVDISGEVNYPGKYELLEEERFVDLIKYAGGMKSSAKKTNIEILRSEHEKYVVLSIDYNQNSDFKLKNGDRINVTSVFENPPVIHIEGSIFGYQLQGTEPITIPFKILSLEIPYYPDITLLQILEQIGGPTPYADRVGSYILKKKSGKKIFFDITKLWDEQSTEHDIEMDPGDYIFVPQIELKVHVAGAVIRPGSYDYRNGLTAFDYIMRAGGIHEISGDKNEIYLIGKDGKRIKIEFDSIIPPGAAIYIDKNIWARTQDALSNISTITQFANAIVSLTLSVIELIKSFIQ